MREIIMSLTCGGAVLSVGNTNNSMRYRRAYGRRTRRRSRGRNKINEPAPCGRRYRLKGDNNKFRHFYYIPKNSICQVKILGGKKCRNTYS